MKFAFPKAGAKRAFLLNFAGASLIAALASTPAHAGYDRVVGVATSSEDVSVGGLTYSVATLTGTLVRDVDEERSTA